MKTTVRSPMLIRKKINFSNLRDSHRLHQPFHLSTCPVSREMWFVKDLNKDTGYRLGRNLAFY